MRSAYDELTHPEPSAAARVEYSKLTNSTSLEVAMLTNGCMDLLRWRQAELEACPAGVAPLIGASYLERNRQLCRGLIEQRTSAPEHNAPGLTPDLFWFRPAGSSWGASDDLRTTLAELRATARSYSATRALPRTTLVVPAIERASHPKRFNRIFDHGILAPPGYLPPAVEVTLIRGVIAVVLVWIPLSDSCGVWIGRATNRVEDLANIEDRLQLEGLERQSTKLWPEKDQAASRGDRGS
jgi:hypothetical protein